MPSDRDLTTAHQAWDRAWDDPAGRSAWRTPEPAVQAVVPLLRERGVRDVLDVGSGIGRHARFLAEQGFTVSAIDASPNGIALSRQEAAAAGIPIDYRVGEFLRLPYTGRAFDFVLAWNVLYHGDRRVARAAFGEIHRVLREGGLLQATMLSARSPRGEGAREIAPDTFVVDGETGDRGHPHLYLDAHGVLQELGRFEPRSLVDLPLRSGHDYHWVLVADRR